MGDYEAVAKQFVDYYYKTFDENRAGLQPLYRDSSYLTFESSQTAGAAAITQKLVELPFQKVTHKIDTTDAQPVSGGAAIIVMVTGGILVDDSQKPLSFSQTFLLVNDGSYHVAHDIFKLIYPSAD